MSTLGFVIIAAKVIGLIAIILLVIACVLDRHSSYEIAFFTAGMVCIFVAFGILILAVTHQKAQPTMPNENTTTTICEHNSDVKGEK